MKALVVHWTGNPRTTAKQNRDYFESIKMQSLNDASARYASAHFIVGISGEVIQCLPSDELAYHVGAKSYTPEALGCLGTYPNNCTVGIELCHREADGRFSTETLLAAKELCALLCVQFGLSPVKDIWRHFDITGKDCPKWFVNHPEEFESFKDIVIVAMDRLRK
ncbi:MAG: N-acetylmuramoyl-L-alanine amidase [Treponema sp.]|nr:N-acetylmuramoyl-L-alanine amidase [Treponema sp.]